MAQFDFPVIDPEVTTGTDLAGYLNGWQPAVESWHSGNSRPTYASEGMLWLDKSGGPTNWVAKFFDGADDIPLWSINPTANSMIWGAGVFTSLHVTGASALDGDVTTGAHIVLTGTMGGVGGATRYIGAGGGPHFFHNVAPGGQHLFGVNEVVCGAINNAGISTGMSLFVSGAGMFGGATGNRGAQIEIVHNSAYNAEASGLYLTTGTGTTGESGIYLFADKANNITGINSLQPGTGARPMWIQPGGGQLRVGEYGLAVQTLAKITARYPGDALEFGHNNPAGYASTIGCLPTNGNPYVAFHAEHGSNPNTFRTRGIYGVGIMSDL